MHVKKFQCYVQIIHSVSVAVSELMSHTSVYMLWYESALFTNRLCNVVVRFDILFLYLM